MRSAAEPTIERGQRTACAGSSAWSAAWASSSVASSAKLVTPARCRCRHQLRANDRPTPPVVCETARSPEGHDAAARSCLAAAAASSLSSSALEEASSAIECLGASQARGWRAQHCGVEQRCCCWAGMLGGCTSATASERECGPRREPARARARAVPRVTRESHKHAAERATRSDAAAAAAARDPCRRRDCIGWACATPRSAALRVDRYRREQHECSRCCQGQGRRQGVQGSGCWPAGHGTRTTRTPR